MAHHYSLGLYTPAASVLRTGSQSRDRPKPLFSVSAETETEAETVIFGRSFQECFIYVVVAFRQMTS